MQSHNQYAKKQKEACSSALYWHGNSIELNEKNLIKVANTDPCFPSRRGQPQIKHAHAATRRLTLRTNYQKENAKLQQKNAKKNNIKKSMHANAIANARVERERKTAHRPC